MFIQSLLAKIKKTLKDSSLVKQFIFFLIYTVFVFLFCIVPNLNSFLLATILLIIFWKIFLGLSWVNVIYLFLGIGEFKLLSLSIRPFIVLIGLAFFILFFFQKLFSPLEDYWRKVINFYLVFFWIFIAYSLYFYLNLPFWFSLLFYLLGLFLFLYLYFLFCEQIFNSKHLILLILGGEIYWLWLYLSLPLNLITFVLFFHYYFGVNYLLSKRPEVEDK